MRKEIKTKKHVLGLPHVIDDFRGACAVKGNGAVAAHVKEIYYKNSDLEDFV